MAGTGHAGGDAGGMTSTFGATQAGTWSVMAVGSVSLVVGIFLGLAIAKD
ncbi:hypothetical protein [Streptomyces sp. NPDC059949]